MLLNSLLLKFWGLASIHNIFNVPLEPERAGKGAKRLFLRVFKKLKETIKLLFQKLNSSRGVGSSQ